MPCAVWLNVVSARACYTDNVLSEDAESAAAGGVHGLMQGVKRLIKLMLAFAAFG